MSLSLRKPVLLLLCKQHISVIGNTKHSISCDVNDLPSLKKAFQSLITEIGSPSVLILLSSSLVNYLALPKMTHWLADADLFALVRSRLSSFYGHETSNLAIAVMRERYGAAYLTSATPRTLLSTLQLAASDSRIRLLGIRPLAAILEANLEKELAASVATAVWLEEVDTIWLGIHHLGSWLSARCIPLHAIASSPRQDVLQREFLAVGLPKIELIYFATQTATTPTEWGSKAINVSERVNTSKHPSRHNLDFIGKRQNRLGWMLIILALIAISTITLSWQQIKVQQLAAEAITQSAIVRRQETIKLIEHHRALSSAQYEFAKKIYQRQTTPWPRLFAAINECAVGSIGLTKFKADATDGTLFIEGEAKLFEDIQQFMDQLTEKPILSEIKIASLLSGNESSAGSIRFSFTGKWEIRAPQIGRHETQITD